MWGAGFPSISVLTTVAPCPSFLVSCRGISVSVLSASRIIPLDLWFSLRNILWSASSGSCRPSFCSPHCLQHSAVSTPGVFFILHFPCWNTDSVRLEGSHTGGRNSFTVASQGLPEQELGSGVGARDQSHCGIWSLWLLGQGTSPGIPSSLPSEVWTSHFEYCISIKNISVGF